MERAYLIRLAVVGVLLAGCGVSGSRTSETRRPLKSAEERGAEERSAGRPPWQLWTQGRDLEGGRIGVRGILDGDARHHEGQLPQALTTYMKVPQKELERGARRGLIARIAGTLLSLKRPEEARAVLSRYFASTNTKVADVDPGLSLLLGWVYSQNNDPQQALAWFSRAHADQGRAHEARFGVEYALSRIPATDFEAVAGAWKGDDFVSRVAAEERRRRRSPGYVPGGLDLDAPSAIEAGKLGAAPSVEGAGAVAVLLPLSGSYGALGRATKNGIDLALGEASQREISFRFTDSSGDPTQAVAQLREVFGAGPVSAILGPLLSEPAQAVSDVAKGQGVPILNLSKRDNFKTGGGVFRLGVTNKSQVRSLLDTSIATLGLSRFGVVYPEDDNGRQFAADFRREATGRGLRVLFEGAYPKGDVSALSRLAEEAEIHDLDGIFFPDNLTNAARFFSSLSPSFRAKIRPLGTANWDNAQELSNSRAALDGAAFVTPFFSGSARPIVGRFVEAYRAAYGDPPDFLAAQGFDAATLLLATLKRVRSEGASFDDALTTIDAYHGVTGEIRIDRSGEIVRRYALVEFVDGELREIEPSPRRSPLFTGR